MQIPNPKCKLPQDEMYAMQKESEIRSMTNDTNFKLCSLTHDKENIM